jgi:glucose-6-phosphate 1-dehydrogenase
MIWTNPLRDPAEERLRPSAGPSRLVVFGATGNLARAKLLPAGGSYRRT